MKGFTLIELLAVIVILAIILMIGIPTIGRVIDGVRVKAFELDARNIINSIEKMSVLDTNFSYDKIGLSNIKDYVKVNPENYSQVSIKKKDSEVYVNIVGSNSWKDMVVCGTKKQLFVNEPEKCDAVMASTCQPISKEEIITKINEGYIPIASANDLDRIRQIEHGDIFAAGTEFEFIIPGVDGFDGIPTNLFIQVADIDMSEFDETGFDPIQLPPSGEIGFNPIQLYPSGEIKFAEKNAEIFMKNKSQTRVTQIADETSSEFVYDGNCNTIRNLTLLSNEMKSTGKVGLFKEIPTKGTVKNLSITDAYVSSTASEGEHIGILAGETESLVNLSKINVSGIISTSSAAAIGGIIGYSNFSTFSETSFSGEIDAENASYLGGILGYGYHLNFSQVSTDATLTGWNKIGGLIGGLDGASITNSYYIGNAVGDYSVGGIVGLVYGGEVTISNSYTYATLSANIEYVGGLIGKNNPSVIITVENSYFLDDDDNSFGKKLSEIGFKNIEKFNNWDFKDTWYMGEKYPLHRVTGLETNYNHGDLIEYTDESCFTFDSEFGVITGYDELCGTDVAIPEQIGGITVLGIMEDSPVTCYDENDDEFIKNKYYINDGSYRDCYVDWNNLPFESKSLTSIILPATLQFIGEASFYQNQLTEIEIPNNVSYIGLDAFSSNFIEQGKFRIDNYANVVNIVGGIIMNNGVDGWSDINPTYLRTLPLTDACFEFDATAGVITGYNPACPSDIVIPSTIGGVTVKGLGYDSPSLCFNGGKGGDLQPKYYINTGSYLYCRPEDREMFFEYGFSATSVVLPNTLEFILDGVFEGSMISELNIPSSLEYLSGFSGNQLTNVTIPATVKYIGAYAFTNNELTNITLNSGLINIGTGAFNENQLTSVTIPNSVIKIYAEAFKNNGITNVTIGNNLQTIGSEGFARNLITEVNIPNSVQLIGDNAFNRNRIEQGLFIIDNYNGTVDVAEEIYENGENGWDVIYPTYLRTLPLTDACFDFNSTYGVITGYNKACPKDIVIPSSIGGVQVKGIAEDSPVYCQDKDNNETTYYDFHVNYDPNVGCYTDGNNYPFENRGITSLVIPSGLEFIMEGAFRNNNISILNVPSSVKYLSGFENNEISTLTLNEGLEKISGFQYNSLTSLYLPNSVTSLAGFSNNQISTLRLPPAIQRIEGTTFYYNQLTNVDIPSTVTYLGSWAFGYNQLTSIVVPPNIVTLDGFSGNQLTSVTIPSTVRYLSGFNDNNFTSIVIPNTVTIIGGSAFSNNQLTSVTIPNSVTEIGNYAFLSNKLTSITIPNSVTKIEYWAFGNNNLIQGSAQIDNTYGNIIVRPDAFLNQGQYPYYQITPTYLR